MRIRHKNYLLLSASFLASLLASQTLFALASPRGAPVEEVEPPSFADVAPIVEVNCTPCHGAGFPAGDVVLETEADLIANKVKVEAAVTSGYMPYGQPDWKDSADGQLLLAWLRAQAE